MPGQTLTSISQAPRKVESTNYILPDRKRVSAGLDDTSQLSDVLPQRFHRCNRCLGADSTSGVQLLYSIPVAKAFGPAAGADVALPEVPGDGQTARDE